MSFPRSPEGASDYVCTIIEEVVTQIKAAMKQALVKFSSKIPAKSCKSKSVKKNANPAGEFSLIDDLSVPCTNSIINEMIRLYCSDISHKTRKRKIPDRIQSFQLTVSSLVKAMKHIKHIHRAPSRSDVLEEGSEESIFGEEITHNAVYTISHILLEAGEKVTSAGSPHSNDGDEITIMESFVRVWPTALDITKTFLKPFKKQLSSDQMDSTDSINVVSPRNRFLSAAFETYISVHKKVILFLLKVQASSSLDRPRAKSVGFEIHESMVDPAFKSGNRNTSSSELLSKHAETVMMNAVKGSRSPVSDEEHTNLDICTDEVIRQIMGMYRKQGQKLTSDHFQSTCTQLVYDVLVRNVETLHTDKKPRSIVFPSSDVPHRRLSHDLIKYLDSAASLITQSASRDLQECIEGVLGSDIQTGSSGVSSKSALDYANVFAPFRLFTHVRNDIWDIFSKVNKVRPSVNNENDEVIMPVMDLVIGEDGIVNEKSSSDYEGFSRGFAQRQFRNADSAINQLRRVLYSNSTMQHHVLVISNAISTILRDMTETSTNGESALMKAYSQSGKSEAGGISLLVHHFVLEFINNLRRKPSILQMVVQTELTTDAKANSMDLSELTKSLMYLIEECPGTRTKSTSRIRRTQCSAGKNKIISVRKKNASQNGYPEQVPKIFYTLIFHFPQSYNLPHCILYICIPQDMEGLKHDRA